MSARPLPPGTLLAGRYEVQECLGGDERGRLHAALVDHQGRLSRVLLLVQPAGGPDDLRQPAGAPLLAAPIPPLLERFEQRGAECLVLGCPGGRLLSSLEPLVADEALLAVLCELAEALAQLVHLGASTDGFRPDRVAVLNDGAVCYVGPLVPVTAGDRPVARLAECARDLAAGDVGWTDEIRELVRWLGSGEADSIRAALTRLAGLVGDGELAADAAVATDPGPSRRINEDAAVAVRQQQGTEDGLLAIDLVAVADGLGGHRDGARAAQLALFTVLSGLTMAQAVAQASGGPFQWHHNEAVREALDSALAAADETVAALGEPGEPYPPAACLALALRVGRRVFVRHLGDCRGYLRRDGRLERLTRDDTVVQGLVDAGRLSAATAGEHPEAHLVTRYVGGGAARSAAGSLRLAQAGDRLLLCSDGVTRVLDDARLADLLTANGSAEQLAERVVVAACRAGSEDNVTVAVLDLHGRPS